MGLVDNQIEWMRKRKYYGPFELNALIIEAHTADETFNEGQMISTPRDETVCLQEVVSYGIVGILFAAADLIYPRIQCPWDLDPRHPVGFRLNFTQTAAVTTDVTWILKVGTDKKDALIQAQDATTIAALDTPIAAKGVIAANMNLWTARGIKNDIGLSRSEVEDGAAIRMELEADTLGVGVTVLTLLGIEMDYVPHRTVGVGSEYDRSLLHTGA